MEKIKVVSLFCGCGGMDLGLLGGFSYLGKEYKKNPYEIVYSIDNDPYCAKIYNANFEHKCEVRDVRDIKISSIPHFDMLIGGFPCQSFSISAQNPPRLGYKDERGMLFFEMVKILKERKPRFFVAENVKGLLSANKGKAFPMIMREFRTAGYHVMYKLLNANDYGVPQKRERVIIVGFRDEMDFNKCRFPLQVKRSERKVLGDVIMEEANNDESLFFSKRAVAGMMAVREKMNKGRVMNLSEPCNTISAHLAKVSLNSTDPVYMVNGRYRRFSTKEAAKIQSFPDTFKFDSVSQTRQYKAIGNAVPPVMMWHVAKQLEKAIVAHGSLSDDEISECMSKNPESAFCPIEEKKLVPHYKQLNFLELFDEYKDGEIVNNVVNEDNPHYAIASNHTNIDVSKNVLISLVKRDNFEQYENQSAKIYYTGKRFPSTVALNKLYYFMPYIKTKGIRDLYLIKVARVGTRKEGQIGEDKSDFRLVFEIDFVRQLFDDYKPIELKIWHTFADTNIKTILAM